MLCNRAGPSRADGKVFAGGVRAMTNDCVDAAARPSPRIRRYTIGVRKLLVKTAAALL